MKRIGLLIPLVLLAVLICTGFHTSAARPKNRYDALPYQQSDITDAALAYISTLPDYKSRYYAGGYPDDGCGTCTDVVGFALLACGYDLQQLVNEDILTHPERYDVEQPDRNIDFRRVKNLIAYFSYHGEQCTLDRLKPAEWQAGDLVIFRNHIGVLSDRRNAEGLPYVIHHSGPFQFAYEEDILGKRDDLLLHVRIGL